MTESLVIIVGQFVILSVLGLAALSVVSEPRRDLLLPAAPIFGAALLAATMSTTSWFWSARWGVLATALIAGGMVTLAARRGRRPWRIPLKSLRTAALVMLVSLPGLAAALIPAWIVGDNMAVMPNSGHDAYYYAAESAWLKDFPIHPGPQIADMPGQGNATPAFGPMWASLDKSVRIGQPMVHAALDVVMGTRSVQTVTPLDGLWVMLVGPAAFVTARLLGARRWAALAAAALSSTSAILIQQAYNQNIDSLLGGSLALLTIGTVLGAIRGASRHDEQPVPDRPEPGPAEPEPRGPRWWQRVVALTPGARRAVAAVLILGALVAVYAEYALFVGPALVGALVVDRVRGFGTRLASLGSIAVLALAIAPSAWIRGFQTLLVSRPVDSYPSPFMNTGRLLAAARLLGVTGIGGGTDGSKFWRIVGLVAVIGLGIVGGIVLAFVLNRHRGAWIAMIAIGAPYVVVLTSEGKGYTQYRTISLFAPLVILVVVLGWAELYPRLRRLLARGGPRRMGIGWRVVLAATVVAVAGGAVVNLRAGTGSLDDSWVRRRHVDTAYADALEWATVRGGADGRDVTVVDADIASQMWLVYTLSELRLVSYPALRPDYMAKRSYWDGDVDPYYIVGPGAFYADGSEVLDQNERFTLVHLGDRPGAVATPTELSLWAAHAGTDGSLLGPDAGQILVLARHLAPGQHVILKLRAGNEGLPVSAALEGKEVATATFAGGLAELSVDLGGRESALVQIDMGRDGRLSYAFDLVGLGLSATTGGATPTG